MLRRRRIDEEQEEQEGVAESAEEMIREVRALEGKGWSVGHQASRQEGLGEESCGHDPRCDPPSRTPDSSVCASWGQQGDEGEHAPRAILPRSSER